MENVAPWFGASPMRVSGSSLGGDEVHRETPEYAHRGSDHGRLQRIGAGWRVLRAMIE